ncbi:MAG: Uma2 family endonuclease [Turicibacter sp.]|nr:Uma2 family endonuclease [Turicibacter sp.]
MLDTLKMSWTSKQHTKLGIHLTTEIVNRLKNLLTQDLGFFSAGTTRLVHYGARWSEQARLVNIAEIADFSRFSAEILPELHSVEPDLLLFDNTTYITNINGSKIAGFPTLVVEIWSESNSTEERIFKQNLYSSAADTEHWYIAQDSLVVEKWCGTERLPDAALDSPLRTCTGLEIDISYLFGK